MTRPWLIDKSALVKLGHSPDRDLWRGRIERGLVHVTYVTLLEMAYSARSSDDLVAILGNPPLSAMPIEHLTPAAERQAVEVLGELAARGQHRAPSIPDLLIAATANQGHLIVLHDDKDFELIADVTGQPLERLAIS